MKCPHCGETIGWGWRKLALATLILFIAMLLGLVLLILTDSSNSWPAWRMERYTPGPFTECVGWE